MPGQGVGPAAPSAHGSPRAVRDGAPRAASSSCRICGFGRLDHAATVAGYRFVECPHCAFTFAPAITAESMAKLYEEGYHGPQDGAPEIGWANAEFLAPALARVRRAPLRILDFGCGQSLVPAMLRDEGHRVIAVDLAPPLRPHPDRLTGPLDALDLAPRSFDLAYAFQVFEHLPEPRPIFDALLGLVRPGGLCLIHTDMEMPEREAGLENWWYATPPDHCAFYRHRTFEALVADTPHAILWREPKSVLIQAGQRLQET